MKFNRPKTNSVYLLLLVIVISLIVGSMISTLLVSSKYELLAIRHKAACTYCTSDTKECRLLWHDEPEFKKACKIFFAN